MGVVAAAREATLLRVPDVGGSGWVPPQQLLPCPSLVADTSLLALPFLFFWTGVLCDGGGGGALFTASSTHGGMFAAAYLTAAVIDVSAILLPWPSL